MGKLDFTNLLINPSVFNEGEILFALVFKEKENSYIICICLKNNKRTCFK